MMDAGNFTEDEKVRIPGGIPWVPGTALPSANLTAQRFVLAEYIKASQVDTDQLVAFIKMHNLQADWFAMQLPGGQFPRKCGFFHPEGCSHNHSFYRSEYASMHARSVKYAGYRVGSP